MEGDGVMNGAGTGISSLSTPLQFIHLLLPTHTHFPLFLFSQLEGDFGDWICFLPQSKVDIRNTFLLQQWIGPGFGMLQIYVSCVNLLNNLVPLTLFMRSLLFFLVRDECCNYSSSTYFLAKNHIPHYIR
jgi:hypothetical protein